MNPRDAVLSIIKRRDVDIDETLARVSRSYERLKDKLSEYVQANRGSEALSIAAARKDMERILVETGVYEAVGNDATYKNYLTSAKEVYSQAYGKNFTYSKVSKKELLLLKDQQFMKFERLTTAGRDLLADSVFNLRLGASSLSQIKAELSSVVDSGLARYVNTWIDTARTSYSNMASTRLAADNGITRFQYVGPEDKITRPFCNEHMDEVKTLEEWDALDNDQINPVSIYRGGYNCRHVLVGVPSDMMNIPEGKAADEKDTISGVRMNMPTNEVSQGVKSTTNIPESDTMSADITRSFEDQINAISGNRNIERFMQDKMDISASIGRADPELIKGFAVEIDRMNKKYRFAEVKKIFTKQAASNEIARAGQSGGVNAVQLTRGSAKSIRDFIDAMKLNVGSGQFPKIDESKYKSFIMTHELGHLIRDGMIAAGAKMRNEILAIDSIADHYITLYESAKARSMGTVFRENKLNPLQGASFDKAVRAETRRQMGDNFLSHYASIDKYEFFSEALSEIENNSESLSPFSARIKKVIDESTLLKGDQ